MDSKSLYTDVVLPLNLPGYYTYRISSKQAETLSAGKRVIVQFGAKKFYAALVRKVHSDAPATGNVKQIISILDTEPILSEQQFVFWEWIAEYYLCTVGQVMSAALPSVFRLASEEKFVIHPDFDGDTEKLSKTTQNLLLQIPTEGALSISDLAKFTPEKELFSMVKSLVTHKILLPQEELNERYTPKKELHISLSEEYEKEDKQKQLFRELESSKRTEKQLSVLLKFMQLRAQKATSHIRKTELTKDSALSQNALQSLIRKGIFQQTRHIVSRLQTYTAETSPDEIVLNEEQKQAFVKIKHEWQTKRTVLLHGVTGSGKTALYIKLIDEVVKAGKQVLYLLPEIALTAQIINRLRFYFGNKVGIYHSRYNDQERAEIWNRVLQNEQQNNYQIILGARSAIFLPFNHIGLVIIDEEHDGSYKQQDPAPHYNGRDAAIYLAHLQNANIILGSATPSIESYFNATKTNKYGYARLKKRYGGIQLPEILCADLKYAAEKKEMTKHFSFLLLRAMEDALNQKEQVILFQNRRGFSVRMECDLCHEIPHCIHCDVSLSYHKYNQTLSCHYCGYTIPIPNECPACHHQSFSLKGFGTERIEEELTTLFPNATVARMDFDSTRNKNAYTQIIQDFEDRKIDILVGTQMVSKGLDFGNVGVVGIVSADNLINFPDFRAFERSFQTMTQVSGRAGRRQKRGKVIIQSYNPWHEAIRNVMEYDYEKMFASQMVERNLFRYPPYFRLIKVICKHRDRKKTNATAQYLATQLRTMFPFVLGPQQPLIGKIRNTYIEEILLKLPANAMLTTAKTQLRKQINALQNIPAHRSVRIDMDVDPL